jgi:peptidoglycan/LPS O-acetylase OafA/YrhL
MQFQWPTIPSAESGRSNHFNALRLIFAVLVLLSHAPEMLDGNRSRELLTQAFGSVSLGEFGVDGFFILSGFLIVRSWRAEPRPKAFLRKRCLRIYPAFVVATLFCALLVGPLAADPAVYFEQLSVAKLMLGMALLGVPIVPPVFDGTPYPRVNLSMWTISIEFSCYLLVLAFGWRKAIERRHIWLGATLLLAMLWACQRMSDLTPWALPKAIYSFPLIRLLLAFFVGACFELYRERVKFTRGMVLAMLGVTLLAMYSARWCELILPVSGGYLLFALAFARSSAFDRFQAIPDISYGVYLYGWPVQKLMFWYWPAMSPWSGFGLTCLACAVLGCLSWYIIEKPSLRLKRPSTA